MTGSPVPPRVPDPERPPSIWSPWKRVWIGHPLLIPSVCGVAYGLITRLVLGPGAGGSEFLILSTGFLAVMPFAMGCLVAWTLPSPRFGLAVLHAVIAVVALLVAALATHLEGSICVVMMAPAALVCSVVGALAATSLRRGLGHGEGRPGGPGGIVPVLLLPFVVTWGETRSAPADDLRVVETSIDVRAPADVVWRNVVRVPEIGPEERASTFFHRIGFPQPIAATISGEGVGAVRHATFERGVLFVETVTVWREGEEIAFTIDPARVPPDAFDEHVIPGGPAFSTLEGRYRLERIGDGTVRLHLSSRSRLTTTARRLVAPWTDAAMRSIQEDILRIVRDRCERGFVPE